MKAGLEAAFATLEAAAIEHLRESAEEEHARSLMAAERAAHEELNAARAASQWAVREAERRQERCVLSRLAKMNNDEAGPSDGAKFFVV